MNNRIILRLLRDPLLHFLILGAGIFLVYFVVNGRASVPSERIVVDENQALRLAEQFQRTRMRPPTWQELEGLTEDFVREEILYREAQALGLDQNDLVIRRRLRQKMEFLSTDLIEQLAPTDAELQTFLEVNKDRFHLPDRFSFQQVYLNPYRFAGDVKQAAAQLLVLLNAEPDLEADPKMIGDATMLPAKFDAATLREVDNVFGRGFAEAIENAPRDRWSGPFESSYGLHLVRMTAREAGSLPTLEEVRSVVEREWFAERRRAANDNFYQALRQRYNVEIRLPADSVSKTLAVRRQ
jgi:hypothetical protein